MARPRQITDEDILRTARACTLERGPQVSLDVVAERLGVTPPALLKRFGSRRALLLAALRPSEDPEWMASVAEGPDERPLQEQLEDLFGRVLDVMVREVPCMVALRESGIPLDEIFTPGTAPQPVRALRALGAWVERARARGMAACDDSETAASAMIGALHGRIFLSHLLRRSWLRQAQNDFVRTLAHMFAKALAPAGVTEAKPARNVSRSPLGGSR